MSDTLQIFGKTYEGVTGLVAKDSGGVDVIYTAGASANLQSNKNVASSSSTFVVAPDSGYDGLEQVTVTGMPEMANPVINYAISSSGLLNITTHTYEGYSPGYIVRRSDQLPTASGSMIVPSSSSQIAVTSGKYTTGDIIVAAEIISPAKVVNPSGIQQVILPDISPSGGTPASTIETNLRATYSGSTYEYWDFNITGLTDGKQYYIQGEISAADGTKIVIDGFMTYDATWDSNRGGGNLTSISTITGASASIITMVEWSKYGNNQIYIDGSSALPQFTTDTEINIYAEPFHRDNGIAQVTVNGAPLQAKTATPSSSQQVITPDTSRIFTVPVGTQLDHPRSDRFDILSSPDITANTEYYIKGQITISDGSVISVNGPISANNTYYAYFTNITSIVSGNHTLSTALWYGSIEGRIMFEFNGDSTLEGLTATITQEFTIDTINSLYSIAAGSSYSMSGGYCAIPVAQGSIDTEYYIYGKLQCPNGANVSIDGEATVGSQGVDLTSITTLDSGIFYNPPYWYNNTFSFELGASSTGNVVLQSPFFIIPTPVTENYYGLSSVTVEASTGVDITPFITRTITSYDIPASVSSIGGYAFATCSSLSQVSLPSNLRYIGVGAFQSCYALTSINLPNNIYYIYNYAFAYCSNLQSVNWPDYYTTFYHYSFYNCHNLDFSALPTGTVTINQYAFANCSSLSLTSLPSTLGYIGQNAFAQCVGLTSLEGTGAYNIQNYGFYSNDNLTSVRFPNTTNIGQSCFAYCDKLELADIGQASQLNSWVFDGCNNLKTLILRRSSEICYLLSLGVFDDTPMRGYNSQVGTIYVPSALISTYQTATNWSTLYTAGTVNFVAIEGSPYEL